MIKQLVEHAIKGLVEEPEKVRVEVFHDGTKTVVEVNISPDDFKRVVGKDGRVVKSIRAMVQSLEPSDKEVVVNIVK